MQKKSLQISELRHKQFKCYNNYTKNICTNIINMQMSKYSLGVGAAGLSCTDYTTELALLD